MEKIGSPFVIQNTNAGWQVTWVDAVTSRIGEDAAAESVSFTVMIPRQGDLTIADVRRYAMKRAVELLQMPIQAEKKAADGQ